MGCQATIAVARRPGRLGFEPIYCTQGSSVSCARALLQPIALGLRIAKRRVSRPPNPHKIQTWYENTLSMQSGDGLRLRCFVI